MPLPFSCPCGHSCSYLNKCFSDRTEGIAQFSKKIIKSTKNRISSEPFNFPCINNEVSTIAQIYTYAIKKWYENTMRYNALSKHWGDRQSTSVEILFNIYFLEVKHLQPSPAPLETENTAWKYMNDTKEALIKEKFYMLIVGSRMQC